MSSNAGGGVSANEYCCAHGARINFGDQTPIFSLWVALVGYGPRGDGVGTGEAVGGRGH